MSEWSTAVDPQLLHRLLQRRHRPGVSRPDHARQLVARHETFAARSELAERLGSRGRTEGQPDVPIVYATATGAGADAAAGTTGSSDQAAPDAVTARPARRAVATTSSPSHPVIQRKALHRPGRAAAAPGAAALAATSLAPTPTVPLIASAGEHHRRGGRRPPPPVEVATQRPHSARSDGAAPDPVAAGITVVSPSSHRWPAGGEVEGPPVPLVGSTSTTAGPSDGDRPTVSVSASRPPTEGVALAPTTSWRSAAAAPPAATAPPVVGEIPGPGPPPTLNVHRDLTLPLAVGPTPTAPAADQLHHTTPAAASTASGHHDGSSRPGARRTQPHAAGAHPTVDIDRLADAVQAKLVRRSAIERERRGARR